MTPKRIAIAVLAILIALLGAYGAGRYAAPTKVELHTEYRDKIEYRDRKVEVEAKAKDVHLTRVVVREPSGKTTTTTTIDAHSKSDTKTDSAATASQSESRSASSVKVADAPRATVSLLVGFHGLDVTRPALGGAVSYRVAGPVVVGAFIFPDPKDLFWGISVGLSF